MRIWIDNYGTFAINFQPENEEEQIALDIALGYKPGDGKKPIGLEPFKSVAEGAKQVAQIGGHESQRWINIDVHQAMRIQK